jgi:hypothetical protein
MLFKLKKKDMYLHVYLSIKKVIDEYEFNLIVFFNSYALIFINIAIISYKGLNIIIII